MNARYTTPRRGIALLLVLVTLVLSVTAVTGLARIAVSTRLGQAAARGQHLADQLLAAADTPILDWLRRHAGRLALPPDAISPRFTVIDERVSYEGTDCRLVITAFDQYGMASTTTRSAATDAFLPTVVLAALDRLGDTYRTHPGLDLLASGAQDAVFPSAELSRLTIGETAATHNPHRPGARVAININTAPLPLIHAVYAARGLGGIEAVIEARTAGRVASPGAITTPRSGSSDDLHNNTPLPVSMSTAWAFRIDCYAGGVRRSWWSIYSDTGSNWERVQRLAITE